MPALHDFRCTECNVVFEDVGTYNEALCCVEAEACPLCGAPSEMVWLRAPGLKADGNLSAEEKVAAALRMGIFSDGKMSIPQTRSDMRKIRAAFGDIPVGERELMSSRPKRRERTESEREADKRETIEMIRKRKAQRRAGEIPRVQLDPDVVRAQQATPISEEKVLAGKKV